MKLSLSSNIQKFRKEKGLTQEQLAESLGVTFAAVSKWERGVATPDLELIATMANQFGISVDKLIGFDVVDNSVEKFEKRIDEFFLSENYIDALKECDAALFRFPNNFEIVHHAAAVNFYVGTKTDDKEYFKKAIDLLERSKILVNPKSEKAFENEIAINSEIAQCYMALREFDKTIELLKKSNVGGLNDHLIAYTITLKDNFKLEEAKPYIRRSFSGTLSMFLHTMWSLTNYYEEAKEYDKGIECMLWLKEFLNNLKKDSKKVSYFDKVVSLIYVSIAKLFLNIKDNEQAKKYLTYAYNTALSFDENPTYKNNNIKYLIDSDDDMFADTFGNTALIAIEKQIAKYSGLNKLYEEVRK